MASNANDVIDIDTGDDKDANKDNVNDDALDNLDVLVDLAHDVLEENVPKRKLMLITKEMIKDELELLEKDPANLIYEDDYNYEYYPVKIIDIAVRNIILNLPGTSGSSPVNDAPKDKDNLDDAVIIDPTSTDDTVPVIVDPTSRADDNVDMDTANAHDNGPIVIIHLLCTKHLSMFFSVIFIYLS